jgi:hypothetical protein
MTRPQRESKSLRYYLAVLSTVLISGGAYAQDWQPVTGAENLKELFSDTTHTATLTEGQTATAIRWARSS